MEQSQRSLYVLTTIIVVIAIALASFFYIHNTLEEKYDSQSTFDYWIDRTLAGKESENNYEYNGYVFVRPNGESEWETRGFTRTGEPYSIKSHYGPRDVDMIFMPNETFFDTLRKPVALISLDSNIEEAGFFPQVAIGAIEISKILGTRNNLLNKEVATGVANPNNATADIPEIDCSFVNENQTVFYYTMANETTITYENGCTIIGAPDGVGFVQASDRIMFGLLGVIRQ